MVQRLGFIGAGQMATALAAGIVQSLGNESAELQLHVFDPSHDAIERMKQATEGKAKFSASSSNQDVVDHSEVVFLAVKPHLVRVALDHVAFANDPLLISVAAGVTEESLHAITGSNRIVRAMPNTPCLLGKGAIGFASRLATKADMSTAEALLSSVGVAKQVPSPLIDAVTGLSGSGPAFVFTFIEALVDAGVLNGLPRTVARELAIQTVLGATQMVAETVAHPATLRDQVTSPGGTTITGLAAMEEGGFRSAVMKAVTTATERAHELGKAD